MSVVPTSLDNLDVCLSDSGLLGKLLLQEITYQVQVAVEEPANKSESEHVTALKHCLVVHSAVSQTVLYHSGEWALDYTVWVDTHLAEVVFSLELSLLQILRTK